ncbi:ABC transporter substrate-binding protein [Rhodoplanes sp. Z2-YC6860]|uniref:ABC transporter substrate-binding protein n=1 Tax=Rhodoplanes sp. Z2-YC6860 TaxID=674703 RepID=UPI00078B6F90|nr:ABC transporter substrate-binding protein [Rhodoplanes sp. Z2-YC6860]AMN39593.1 ABC transporter substrate binding protein [Rhodoplanes sp. Z2-YC6860]
MTDTWNGLSRRHVLAATGATALTAGFGLTPAAAADVTIRQGYQTNIWGMPTYYLMKSGYLEKRGLKTEDFAVPSGNLTMQQMVARQVDMGTYAGPSLIIGHDKGGLVAIAQIETVGATGAMVVRKDLGIKTIAELKGKKIANQTGSSIGNIFIDQVCPANGLKKGEFQEVRMDVNNMIAAMAAKTVDAMINIEPYNAIAEAEGLGVSIMDLSKYDQVPVFMAATPDFVEKQPDAIVAYLKAWLDVKKDFKENPKKAADVIYSFFTSKGYDMKQEVFAKAMGRVAVDPGFPKDLVPYMTGHAEVLLKEKKIAAIPDWKKLLRTDFMDKARAGA